MSAGGIYDHLGGGYARYSTDAEWLAPHFEKMLYDNAQILELLALVHAHWPIRSSRARPRTVGWLMREMRVERAFAASLDADQDGEEAPSMSGPSRRSTRRSDRVRPLQGAYDVTRRGNWEGRTVLRRVTPRGAADEEAELEASRAKLFALREGRAKPARDDKVLADWNGLTIAALVRVSVVLMSRMARDRPLRLRLRHDDAARRRRAAPARLAPGRCGARRCSTITPPWRGRRSRCSRRAAIRTTSARRCCWRPKRSTCSATARAASF